MSEETMKTPEGRAPAKKSETMPRTNYERLLELLAPVRAVRLNTGNHAVFAVPGDLTDRFSPVVFSLTLYQPVAVFGKGGVPKLIDLPERALDAIAAGLQRNYLLDVSQNPEYVPIQRGYRRGARVPEGKDPIEASGKTAREMFQIMTISPTSANPVEDMIKNIGVKGWETLPVLIGLNHFERTSSAPRLTLIAALERRINELDSKYEEE